MTIGAVRQSPAVRWLPAEPFAHLDDIHHRTSRGLRALTAAAPPGGEPPPAVDVEETADEFVIEVDLPGATAPGVIVQWNDRHLIVHGRIPARTHTIRLPGPVQGDQITATLTNGVLTIHAPKAHPCPAVCIIDPDTSDGQLP